MKSESSITFKHIIYDLRKHSRLYIIVLPVAFLLAALYSLGQSNFYTTTVKLSPEIGGGGNTSSLSSIASSFGLNLGSAGGSEAIYPALYPDLMNSVDFKTSLFSVMLTLNDGRKISYYNYLLNEQKQPWWLQLFRVKKGKDENTDSINPFRLTIKQTRIVNIITRNVICNVDKKTSVFTISVIDQDPVISAQMADSVKNRLQRFITDYRTSKVRVDYEYYKKLFKEAKQRYEKSRQLYSTYADANQDVILESAKLKIADLENDMQLSFNIYEQIAKNLQQAEMLVQQEVPAFTTLQSATVPLVKSGPSRSQMCLVFTFFTFILLTVYVLYKENDLKDLMDMI